MTPASKQPAKKILCVDFDGVIHLYTSGWQGVDKIPDPPVPNALVWLDVISDHPEYEIAIYSSRSKEAAGIAAMKSWFIKQYCAKGIYNTVEATAIVARFSFPTQKPAAYLTIDDRAICFDGHNFPTVKELAEFKPWNKR